MANITLKIDDDLLDKARQLASQKKTSINAIVRGSIEGLVSQDMKREAALKGLESFFLRCKAKVGHKYWTRDQIHDR